MYITARLPIFFRALPRHGCKGRAMFFYLHRGNNVFYKVHGLEVSSRIKPALEPEEMPVVMVETHNFQSLDANGCKLQSLYSQTIVTLCIILASVCWQRRTASFITT